MLPVLCQRGHKLLDSNPRFLSHRTELDPNKTSFIIFISYDVTDTYYDWFKTSQEGRGMSQMGPIRFEEEIVDVGMTSHTWRSNVFTASGEHLVTWILKMSLIDKKTKKTSPVDDDVRTIAQDYFRTSGRRSPMKVLRLSEDDVRSSYTLLRTSDVTIIEKNIDSNNHTNFLVYPRVAITALLDAVATQIPAGTDVRLKKMHVFFEQESFLGDRLDLEVFCRSDEMDRLTQKRMKLCGTLVNFVVQIFRKGKRITFCKFVCSLHSNNHVGVKALVSRL